MTAVWVAIACLSFVSLSALYLALAALAVALRRDRGGGRLRGATAGVLGNHGERLRALENGRSLFREPTPN